MQFPVELGVSSDEPGYRMNAGKKKRKKKLSHLMKKMADKLKGSNMGNDSTSLTR